MSVLLRKIDDARAFSTSGSWPEAADAWRQVVAEAPTHAGAREALAHGLLQAGELPEALAAYEYAARLHASQHAFLKAVALCNVILQHDPKRATATRMLTELHTGLKNEQVTRASPSAGPTALARTALRTVAVEPGAVPVLPEFPLFAELGRAAFVAVTSGARLRHFGVDQVIVREGDQGDSMFAIVKGSVEVRRADADGQLVALATLQEGTFFGEMALLSGAARIATVVAVEDCALLEFGRTEMQQVVAAHPGVGGVLNRFHRRRLITALVRSSEVFRVLPAERREELAAAFRARTLARGTVVIQEGTRGEAFYLVLRGTCSVSRGGRQLSTLGEGGVAGEMSLLLNMPTTATVTTASPCTLLRLSRAQFDALVLSNPEARQMLTRMVAQRQQQQDGVTAEPVLGLQASW